MSDARRYELATVTLLNRAAVAHRDVINDYLREIAWRRAFWAIRFPIYPADGTTGPPFSIALA